MTRPMSLSDFPRLPRVVRAALVEGLPAAIDRVAEAGPASHRFLRHQWFAAALRAYGGRARTLLAHAEDAPVLAMPLVAVGARWLGLASVPGCYWPFRGFPVGDLVDDNVFTTALAELAGAYRAIRIGPVADGDAAVAPLIDAARAAGWGVIDRVVAESFVFDMAAARTDGAWPRNSTLRKNRFHEKHLAEHGSLDWRMIDGAAWPAAFDILAAVETKSWQADAGDDAKFTDTAHAAFWRAAAEDPAIAAMFHAAVLSVDGAPAAFSFDVDAGDLRYAIANSYAPEYAKHSPGKLLYYRNLVDGVGRGIARVDWGAGDSGYKQTIGAEAGPMLRDWVLLRPGVTAVAGRALRGFWRASGR